ncbi:MAG: hypothetical protein HQL38_18965 [Alphaproteobacteria bacterium]|nr:hypothetical protein [Alphaproteobacteria bacterium]
MTRAVIAGLAPGLATMALLPLALESIGLGVAVMHFPFVIAQAPLIACLDYGADEKSALPGRIAKPMLRWSVVAGLAPVLIILAGDAWRPLFKGGFKFVPYGFLGATLMQAPLLALFNLAIAVWGSQTCDRESDEGWRWAGWGLAAIGASLSGLLALWLISEIQFRYFRPPLLD